MWHEKRLAKRVLENEESVTEGSSWLDPKRRAVRSHQKLSTKRAGLTKMLSCLITRTTEKKRKGSKTPVRGDAAPT